jgi:hypothetical protein
MFTSYLDDFNFNKETVFQYLILNKDFKNWIPPEKGILSLKNHFVEEKLKSIEMLCDIDSRKATIWLEVTHYEPYKEVRFYSSNKAGFENGESIRQGRFFPFNYMAFRTIFSDTAEGCKVLQDVYINPNGLIGWVICKLVILPRVKNEMKNCIVVLRQYLNSLPKEIL